MLSLISMVTPRLVSSNLTLPWATSGCRASIMSLATLFIFCRCSTFFFGLDRIGQFVGLGNRLDLEQRGALDDRYRLTARLAGRVFEGIGQEFDSTLYFLVDRGDGIHDDEKGKQQGNEIGIGNQPALVVFRLFGTTPAGHQCR